MIADKPSGLIGMGGVAEIAETRQIGGDDAVAARERVDVAQPMRPRAVAAMQQHERRPLAPLTPHHVARAAGRPHDASGAGEAVEERGREGRLAGGQGILRLAAVRPNDLAAACTKAKRLRRCRDLGAAVAPYAPAAMITLSAWVLAACPKVS